MKKNIIKDTVVVMLFSILSKTVGFINSVIQATYYGSNQRTDAYNVANGFVSNIIYMIATALSVAFVPIYIQKKTVEDKYEVKKFSTRIITALFLLSLIIVLSLELFAPIIMKFIAPSYEGGVLNISILYFRVLAIGFVFSSVTALYQNLLNAEKIYGYVSISSLVNSVVIIINILLFGNTLGVWALVISAPLSYSVQFLLLSMKGKKFGKISFRYGIKDKAFNIIVMQAIPILISQATVEINQVIDRALLIDVAEGAVTSVSYSAILYQFASGIIILPLSTVVYTELAEAGAKNDKTGIKDILKKVNTFSILICLPITLITIFTSTDIVNIVFGYGKFDEIAVSQTSIGLLSYIICLIPETIKSIILRAYYSLNDTKRPMMWGILEVIMNISLSLVLVRDFGIMGVVGATGIASFVFLFIMSVDFYHKYFYLEFKIFRCWKIVFSGLGSGIFLLVLRDCVFYNSLLNFVLKSILTLCLYFVLLLLTKEEITMFFLKKLLKRSNQ